MHEVGQALPELAQLVGERRAGGEEEQAGRGGQDQAEQRQTPAFADVELVRDPVARSPQEHRHQYAGEHDKRHVRRKPQEQQESSRQHEERNGSAGQFCCSLKGVPASDGGTRLRHPRLHEKRNVAAANGGCAENGSCRTFPAGMKGGENQLAAATGWPAAR